jgi:ABC-type sugar transport system substrate-binding protein
MKRRINQCAVIVTRGLAAFSASAKALAAGNKYKRPNITVPETRFNDDDANKTTSQFQFVLASNPDLAGVFGASVFSATGASNGAKQGGATGKEAISHNLNDIFQVSDRILVLRRGEKVGERLISQTNHDEVVRLMVAG